MNIYINRLSLGTLGLVVGLLTASCSPRHSTAFLGGNSDVFVSTAPKNFAPVSAALVMESRDACATQVRKVICQTDATTDAISQNWNQIDCSPASDQEVDALMSIYDEMPELLRPSLCTLSHIFISDGIASTAFASPIVGAMGGMPVGGFAGFRKSSFLNQPSIDRLITWKEQLAFGGAKEFLSNDPSLVQIQYNLKMDHLKQSGLYYVVMHELGHLIDFENNINESCMGDCSQTQAGWMNLSWNSRRVPKPEAKFFRQEDICYYNCTRVLNPFEALKIYQSLQQSAFVTTYAGSNTYEDFAEFWTWYLNRQLKNPDYHIQIPGQGDVDMNKVFENNDKIRAKLAFIDKLYHTPQLRVAHGQESSLLQK